MTKPKIKYNSPSSRELLSMMGYSDNSPFKARPYIDINTPTGKIDMSNTGIPILANDRVLPPYSGIHDMGTTKVREIPLKNTFKWSPGQKRNLGAFVHHNPRESQLIGGAGYTFPTGTQLNATGILPMGDDPIFRGVVDMGIKQNFGNTDIGLNLSSPILNDPHEYFANQNVQKLPLQFKPKLSLTHRFRDGGQPLPKAQIGLGDIFNWDNVKKAGELVIDPIGTILDTAKNKIADNVDPYGYGNEFDRLYNAIFTTKDKEHDYDWEIGEDQSGERRDLLHMMLGLDQEGNTIPQQNQYVPSKGHNEGDIYYSSPVTEKEIQEEINKIGLNKKEIFYSQLTNQDEKEADKEWERNLQDDFEWEDYNRLVDQIDPDNYNAMYDGKEITFWIDDDDPDRDNYIYYKDVPEYKNFVESDEYGAWEKKTKAEIEKDYQEIEYPDFETFLTTPGNEEKGTSQSGGFYGGVLGNFTLNQGEDEKGKYISYYDKWDLNPFKDEGDWKEKLSDFGQEYILNVDPTSIYNRMYYTEDEKGNYVFEKKYGGGLPEAQFGWFEDRWDDATDAVGDAWDATSDFVSDTYDDISEGVSGMDASDWGHMILDGAGFIPGYGEAADGLNALWYNAEGDYTNAGISTAAMIPFVGWGATAGKYGTKVVRNAISNSAKVPFKQGQKQIAKEVTSEIPKWSKGVTEYGQTSFKDAWQHPALMNMVDQGKHLDAINFDASTLSGKNMVFHGVRGNSGRNVVEVALPDGRTQLFYNSSGLAGKRGAGAAGTTEGLWQPYGGHAKTNWSDDWFIKDGIDPKTGELYWGAGDYEDFYGSQSYRDIAGNLDKIAAEEGWDMSGQILKSKQKYGGGLPKAQYSITDNPITNLAQGKGQKIVANNVIKGAGTYFGANAFGRGVSSFLSNPYLLPVAAGVEGINFMGTEEGEAVVNEQKTIDNLVDENDLSQSLKTWGHYSKMQRGGQNDLGFLQQLKKNFVTNIMPFDYDEHGQEGISKEWWERVIDTSWNDEIENKRENLDEEFKRGNISSGNLPKYQERIDLLNMFAGFDQVYDSVPVSEYRPTQGDDEDTIYYDSPYARDEIKNRFKDILQWSKTEGWDINDFARGFYDRDGDESRKPDKDKMVECNEGDPGCVKTKDGWFFGLNPTYEMKNPQYKKGMYSKTLGNFKLDMGTDDHGHYISYYDNWNLNPTGVGMLDGAINTIGGLNPPQIYGRIYYNPDNGQIIKGPGGKKRKGGEFNKRIGRLNQQLSVYNEGGKISPIAEKELLKLNLIKPKAQRGTEVVEQNSYVVKKGDNLHRIASRNNMSLSQLLTLNPKYLDNPSSIYSGDRISLSENTNIDKNTADLEYNVKSGDTLSKIASKYGVRYQDIARLNNISDPSKIRVNQKIILPDNANTNDPNIKRNIDIAESPYTTVSSVDVDEVPGVNNVWNKRVFKNGKWTNNGKRNVKTEINKMDQADRIIQGINEINSENTKTINYEVKSGDALSLIAENNGVTVERLMEDNNIEDASKIQAGQEIKINRSSGKPYIVMDEKAGRMHLYYPGQDKPTKSYPILTGANEGDAQTVTKIGVFKDGVKISQDDLNKAMTDNDITSIDELVKIPGYSTETDWEAGNKQSGAGVYTIKFANEDSGYYDDSGQGRKTPSFVLNNSNGSEVPMVIHTVPSSKDADRINSLKDSDGSNNRMTNGCINGSCTALTELYENPDIGEGTQVYVLPEDAGNNFVFENGEINFYTKRQNQEDAQTYIDERGDEQSGHGIANKRTSSYKPINITFDKNHYQTNSERYDGTAEGEEEEFVNNTQPFLNALTDNKKFMMDKLGMDGDMYNDLSMIAFGIYGYESGMGDEGSGAENLVKAGMKYMDWGDTSPDVKSKYNTYNVDGEANSVGWTQIRWNQLDDSEKDALAKINITSNDQLMDPANSAMATTAILYKRYQNQISVKDKNSEDFDIYTELPKKWNKAEDYPNMVNKYMDYITVTETDIDDVDNNLIIKGDYTDDNAVSNERISNKDWKEQLLNLPETIEHEYNTSEYVKPTVDAVKGGVSDAYDATVEGGKGVLNSINSFFGGSSSYWKAGGEFGMRNQVQLYNDYLNGVYKGTKQEKKANKIYEKLNRLYYNDSKKSGKHQLDIMKGILKSNR